MSLVGTLAKVAVGAMVAKGVGGMLKGGGAGGGLGGLLGSALGGKQGQQGGGLSDLLGGGGGQRQGGGGLGDLLGSALGGGGGAGGGLGGLGGLLGGGGQQGGAAGGGLGGLLDALGGGQSQGGSLGDLLNSALQGNTQASNPTAEQQAEVCLRAMLVAARADGQIDAAEQQKITGHLGDMSDEEANFIRNEMANPTDLNSLVKSVPQGMEQQVYLMSLMAIDLDTQVEAQYLDSLAKGLNIDQQTSNAIHQKLGVPALYS